MKGFGLTSAIKGKRIVGILRGRMSSNNQMVNTDEGLILEDAKGRRSYLRWNTIEETDGAYYGLELIYPGRAPREEETAQ
jgi:hypothetical protein